MAKELKAKFVLETGDFSRSLKDAERQYKRTVAEIEKTSGKTMTAIRGDLLGGIGSGGKESMREMKAYLQEQKVLMRTGRQTFDAQIGGMTATRVMTQSGVRQALDNQKLGAARMTLERTIKTAAEVAAGITAADIATKVWKGDIQGAADTIKRLPFGIGQVAVMLESVIGAWSGITSEVEKYNRLASVQEETVRAINDQLRQRAEWEKQNTAEIQAQINARQLAGAEGFQRTELTLAQQEKAELERVDAEAKQRRAEALKARNEASRATRGSGAASPYAFGKSPEEQYAESIAVSEATRSQREVIQQNYQNTLTQIEESAEAKRAAIRSRYDEERRVAHRDEMKRLNEQAEKQDEVAAKDAKRLEAEAEVRKRASGALASELLQKQLASSGKGLAAELEAIEQRYRERSADAGEEDRKKLSELAKLERADALKRWREGREVDAGGFAQITREHTAFGGVSTSSRGKVPIIGDPTQTEYLKRIAEGYRVARAA